MNFLEPIQNLFTRLLPTGTAFKGPVGGVMQQLNTGLSYSENQAYKDALSILDTLLPDNANFDADTATEWERRLGLVQQPASVDIELRKMAIARKMQHPGKVKARQHWNYIQGQLRAAGFDVYVYENIFSDGMGGTTTKPPAEIAGYSGLVGTQHKTSLQHGQRNHGGGWGNIVANSIDRSLDVNFNPGATQRGMFFIGGPDISDPSTAWAYVLKDREAQFRQLILQLKPARTAVYLFVLYI